MSDSSTWHMETPEIEPRKISRNSNGHNVSHRGPIQAHHISRRSKLNNGTFREILMVISYHTKVRFRNITLRCIAIYQSQHTQPTYHEWWWIYKGLYFYLWEGKIVLFWFLLMHYFPLLTISNIWTWKNWLKKLK